MLSFGVIAISFAKNGIGHPVILIKSIYTFWTTIVSNVLKSLQLEDADKNGECTYDYLEIVDGDSENSGDMIGKFCGTDSLGSFLSSGNKLFIKFKTDSSRESQGFTGSYEIGNILLPCF